MRYAKAEREAYLRAWTSSGVLTGLRKRLMSMPSPTEKRRPLPAFSAASSAASGGAGNAGGALRALQGSQKPYGKTRLLAQPLLHSAPAVPRRTHLGPWRATDGAEDQGGDALADG